MSILVSVPFLCLVFVAIVSHVFADGEMSLGMECESSLDCKVYAYCGPGRVCTCRDKYVPNRDNTTCLAGIGQRCEYDDSCVPYAFCRHQERCECKHGFLPSIDQLHCTSGAAGLSMGITAAIAKAILFQ